MTSAPLRIAVIVASTREGRFAPTVSRWLLGRARARPDVEVDVIDLAELALPPTMSHRRSPAVEAYAARIARADGFVVVTPEYNHGYPAALKHAIDLCHAEWHRKAVAFVSYGGVSGGLRAVEQLRQVFAEVHVVGVRDTVSFHGASAQFGEDGQPLDAEGTDLALATMLDHLVWWGSALRTARRADADTRTDAEADAGRREAAA